MNFCLLKLQSCYNLNQGALTQRWNSIMTTWLSAAKSDILSKLILLLSVNISVKLGVYTEHHYSDSDLRSQHNIYQPIELSFNLSCFWSLLLSAQCIFCDPPLHPVLFQSSYPGGSHYRPLHHLHLSHAVRPASLSQPDLQLHLSSDHQTHQCLRSYFINSFALFSLTLHTFFSHTMTSHWGPTGKDLYLSSWS